MPVGAASPPPVCVTDGWTAASQTPQTSKVGVLEERVGVLGERVGVLEEGGGAGREGEGAGREGVRLVCVLADP